MMDSQLQSPGVRIEHSHQRPEQLPLKRCHMHCKYSISSAYSERLDPWRIMQSLKADGNEKDDSLCNCKILRKRYSNVSVDKRKLRLTICKNYKYILPVIAETVVGIFYLYKNGSGGRHRMEITFIASDEAERCLKCEQEISDFVSQGVSVSYTYPTQITQLFT